MTSDTQNYTMVLDGTFRMYHDKYPWMEIINKPVFICGIPIIRNNDSYVLCCAHSIVNVDLEFGIVVFKIFELDLAIIKLNKDVNISKYKTLKYNNPNYSNMYYNGEQTNKIFMEKATCMYYSILNQKYFCILATCAHKPILSGVCIVDESGNLAGIVQGAYESNKCTIIANCCIVEFLNRFEYNEEWIPKLPFEFDVTLDKFFITEVYSLCKSNIKIDDEFVSIGSKELKCKRDYEIIAWMLADNNLTIKLNKPNKNITKCTLIKKPTIYDRELLSSNNYEMCVGLVFKCITELDLHLHKKLRMQLMNLRASELVSTESIRLIYICSNIGECISGIKLKNRYPHILKSVNDIFIRNMDELRIVLNNNKSMIFKFYNNQPSLTITEEQFSLYNDMLKTNALTEKYTNNDYFEIKLHGIESYS